MEAEAKEASILNEESEGFFHKLFSRNLTGVVASLVLTAFTLILFFRLQMYGPLSALSRFNKYAVEWNTKGILSVTAADQRNGGYNTQQMAAWIHDVGSQSAKASITRFQQRGSVLMAQVVYTLPDGRTPAMIFILTESNGVWRVDPDKSVDALRSALGQRSQT